MRPKQQKPRFKPREIPIGRHYIHEMKNSYKPDPWEDISFCCHAEIELGHDMTEKCSKCGRRV